MKHRILFFGDSNTYGYEPDEYFGGRYPASVRWTDRLAEMLEDTWEILPYGLNGRCIPDLTYEESYVDAMIRNASPIDVFAVMLGTNDVALTPHPDAEAAARSMDSFLSYLQKRKERFQILLIAPPAMAAQAAADPMLRPYVEETEKLVTCYAHLAEEHPVLFADANAWNIDMAFDHTHFSKEGHRVFAEQMAACLQRIDLL